MNGTLPRDRARKVIAKAGACAKEVAKKIRNRIEESPAKERIGEARERLRQRTLRAAEWVEKRARDVRVRLEGPVEATPIPAPLEPLEAPMADTIITPVTLTPEAIAPEEVVPEAVAAEPVAAEAAASPESTAAEVPEATVSTEVPVEAAPPAAEAEEAPKKKRPARPRTKKAGTGERKRTTKKKAVAEAVAPVPVAAAIVAAEMELRELGNDVYACLQQDRGLGTSNSGLVSRGGGLVVDTFWDLPHTRQLIEHYARVWKEPARRVVNTHHNGDHCWGNQLFPEAEIIGHRLCAQALASESPGMMQAVRDAIGSGDPALEEFAAALREWDFSGIELTPPTILVEDRLDLDLDGLAVHLIYVGPAHTAGDLIVHLPEQRVVFAGDVLFRLCTPIGWEGTYERWMGALDDIIALDPEVIVPGHGPLCGTEGAREMREYLAHVRQESRRFFDQELPVIEAARRIDLGPFAGWTQPERVIFNVARAYREFRGEPFDAPIDVTAMIRGMHELRHDPGFGRAHSTS